MDKLCLSGPKHRPRTAQRTSRSGWRPLLSDMWGPMSCPIPAHLAAKLINTFESCCSNRLLLHCGGLRDLDAIPTTKWQIIPVWYVSSISASLGSSLIPRWRLLPRNQYARRDALCSKRAVVRPKYPRRGADGVLPLLSQENICWL